MRNARTRQLGGRPPLTWNSFGWDPGELDVRADWPQEVTREWAWGGSCGRGVRVCLVDSGIEGGHPGVGLVQGSFAVNIERPSRLVREALRRMRLGPVSLENAMNGRESDRAALRRPG